MTAKQWRMLEAVDWHSGHGTIEVIMEYGECDSGTDAQNWSRSQLAAGAVFRSLKRLGLVTDADGSWDITDAGANLLKSSGRRVRVS